MIYLKLFLSFLQVGMFSFGGGYAALPLIQHQVVDSNGWMTVDEFSHLISISQITPGAIAINASTFVGTRVAGFPGAICATLGCVLPSCVIVLLLLFLYKKYRERSLVDGAMLAVRPTIVGLILSAGIVMMGLSFFGGGVTPLNLDAAAILIACGGFIVLRKTRCPPLLLIFISGGIGFVIYSLADRFGG